MAVTTGTMGGSENVSNWKGLEFRTVSIQIHNRYFTFETFDPFGSLIRFWEGPTGHWSEG